MPISLTNYTDLSVPTPNGDGTTYGTIINQWFEDLTTKIDSLATRISDAQTQLGSTATVGSILYNINQVNTINTLLEADGVTSAKTLTGTPRTLLPDPLGSYTNATAFPAFTGSGEALNGITPPTTEAEVLAFDYAAFATALNSILSTIATRVAQTEADISSARVNICKTKKYTDAKQAGGTTVRTSETVFFTVNGIGQFLNTASYDFHSNSYSSGNLTVNYTLNASTNGVTAGQTAAEAHQTFVTEGMLANGSATTVYANEGAAQSGLNLNDIYMHKYNGALFPLTTSSGTVLSNTYQVTWYPTSSTYQLSVTAPAQSSFSSWNSNLSLFSIRKRRVIETIQYTTPDVSSCDSSPGGPHFTSGSYT